MLFNKSYFLNASIIAVLLVLLLAFYRGNIHLAEEGKLINSNKIDILHYTLNLNILDFTSRQISGIADLQVMILEDNLFELCLDLLSLKVDSVWIDEVSIEKYFHDGKVLIIPFKESPRKGYTLLVTVFYHGKPVKDPQWGGFYFSEKHAFNIGVGMGYDLHPLGRVWYPCVDSFTDRATYDYFITVQKPNIPACPGTLMETFNNDDGTITYHWMLNTSIPTYLSAVSVANYICISDTLNGLLGEIPVNIFVLQKDSLNAVEGFRDLDKWLNCFESFFGPYRWEKIGFVSVPFQSGAMEHATMISIPDYSLKKPESFQDLFIHEFAHNWFGNLVTCASSADMWFNEGWASYCEALYYEYYYGKIKFRDCMRKNHLKTLKYAHIHDEAYRALYNNNPKYTYGSTVYDKGADVAHTLRNYIGDEKFFTTMKSLFSEYAFHHISTSEFQSFLERKTELQLEDFFNFWVESPGFPHFSVDSFSIQTAGSGYKIKVFFRQRLLGTSEYSYSNHVDLMFMDSSWESYAEVLELSGSHGSQDYFIPFKPELVILDPYEKIADATLDEIITIREIGNYSFEESGFFMKVTALSDSVFFRVTRNWVSPDLTGNDFVLDPAGYWTIEALLNREFKAETHFLHENPPEPEILNASFYKASINDLVLLFREGAGDHWEKIPSTLVIGKNLTHVISSQVKNGEYCLGFKN